MTQVGNLAERAVKLFDTDVLTLRQAAKLAGEPLATFTKRCSAQGVPVDATTWQEILDAATKLEVDAAMVNAAAGLQGAGLG